MDDVAREFGEEIGELVDGLTEISHLTFRSSVEEQSRGVSQAAALGGRATPA